MEKAIEIRNLYKFYGEKQALNNLSFVVEKGTIHGLLGPNGSGKSTTLNILIGLVLKTYGNAHIEGKVVAEDPYFSESLAFVCAEPKFPDFSVEDYVLACATLRGISESEALEKLDNNSVLAKLRKSKCKELSTGEKKTLQLFVASLYKPEIIVLDEPYNGLDISAQNILTSELFKIKKRGGSVLISTHIMSYLEELVDSITLIKEGKVVFSGSKTSNIKEIYKKHFSEEKDHSLFSF